MKRKMILRGMLALALALVLCPSARADLRRGSRGDSVRELQQMMIDLGVLEDAADGAFGRKTEAAVKKLQQYWGLRQSGRADDAFLLELNDLWHLALGNGTESGADPEEDLTDPADSCVHNESAPYGFDYCWRHDEGKALRDLLNPGRGRTVPDGLKKVVLNRIAEYWLEQIGYLYDEWEENDDSEDGVAGRQREIFEAGWAETEADLADAGGGPDTMKTLEFKADWLETMGIELCFDLHGAEPNLG